MRVAFTLVIFTAMVALVVLRPRRWSEAWWTVLGGGLMLALGLVSPHDAFDAVFAGKSALLFLLSLLLLSLLVGKSGFFDWAAIWCARMANGDARALYRNAFLLGAIITTTFSLDTTAVILTPVMLSLVKRLRLASTPYVVLCAFVANVGSLFLPISNLTNLLFADGFHVTFSGFALRMLAPQLVALATTYALLRIHFRHELPERFPVHSLPEPRSVLPHRGYFIACVTVLAVVLVGYFVAPLMSIEPYVVAFAGGVALIVAGAVTARVRLATFRELSWGIFPFVVGLFVAVRGLANLGVVGAASAWLLRLRPDSLEALLAVAGATALASNVINNLPAALIAKSVLSASHAPTGTVLAALVGSDVGSIVTPFGSLATMLVLATARREGEEVRTKRIVLFGAWSAPLIVIAATLALAATVRAAR